MRPVNQKRPRGNRSSGRRPHPNNANRNYDSNGPEVKIRGSASHIFDRYCQLARDASASGDRIAAENHLQHAEHYYRIMLASGLVTPRQTGQRGGAGQGAGGNGGGSSGYDDDEDEDQPDSPTGYSSDQGQEPGQDGNRGETRHSRPGRQEGGRQDGGRQDGGRQESGRQDSSRQDSGRQHSGRHESGRHDSGSGDPDGGFSDRPSGAGLEQDDLEAMPETAREEGDAADDRRDRAPSGRGHRRAQGTDAGRTDPGRAEAQGLDASDPEQPAPEPERAQRAARAEPRQPRRRKPASRAPAAQPQPEADESGGDDPTTEEAAA